MNFERKNEMKGGLGVNILKSQPRSFLLGKMITRFCQWEGPTRLYGRCERAEFQPRNFSVSDFSGGGGKS